MAIMTEFQYTPDQLPDEQIVSEILAKAEEMSQYQIAPMMRFIDPITGNYVRQRFWIDQESADKWVAFMMTFNIASYKIQAI